MPPQDDSCNGHPGPPTVKPNGKKGKCGRKQLSCLECKRSKLKCELRFPCSSCIKKGCADICPRGSLIPTKSNIQLKIKKDNLQESVRRLQARARALENEIRDAYGHISSSPHPLLQNKVKPVIGNLQSTNTHVSQKAEKDEADDLLDAFGSLTIGAKGQIKYNGSSSSAEHLLRSLMPDDLQSPFECRDNQTLPPCIDRLVNIFPYGAANCDDETKRQLLQFLPSQKTASHLSSAYFNSASSVFPPIDESDFTANVLSFIYNSRETLEQPNFIHFHKVSVLFIVLAGGTVLADESDNIDATYGLPSNTTADLYFRLSRAAFSVEHLGNKSNTWTIATLLVMVHYSISVAEGSFENRWFFFDLILRISYMIGLHRDPSHWGLNESESQRRRDLFWEVLFLDLWFSITNGRPTSIDTRFTDCRFERDMEPGIGQNGEVELGFRAYMRRMMVFYVSPLSVYMFRVGQLNYAALLKLEEDFRNFECPSQLQCPTSGIGDPVNGSQWAHSVGRAFQQYYACVYYKECTLLYVHRRYVIYALKINNSNPLQTKYGPSVLSSIKSSIILLGTLRSLLGRHFRKTSRMLSCWSSAFSATFMLGSLVYVCPGSSIAKQAFQAFEDGVNMFITFRHKDKSGPLLTDNLVKLRTHVRRALFDTKRTSSGLTAESRVDACLTMIRMLEGKSGLTHTNPLRDNCITPPQMIPEKHGMEYSQRSTQSLPTSAYPFMIRESSGRGKYSDKNSNPPFPVYNPLWSEYAGLDIAPHIELPEAKEQDLFSKGDIGLDSVPASSSFLPGPPDLSTLEMLEQRSPPLADWIDPNDDVAWEVFINQFEW